MFGLDLVDRRGPERPGVTEVKELRAAQIEGTESGDRRASLARRKKIVERVIVEKVISREEAPAGAAPIHPEAAFIIAQAVLGA